MSKEYTVIANENIRADKLISIENISRSGLQNLFESGNITCGGKVISKNYKANIGDELKIIIPEPENIDVTAENIPLDIVFEDKDLLVVNKPKGMVVHPAPGNYSGTLVNALIYHCADSLSGINGKIRPGIVHRIDKDTSGLLIVAKNDISHNFLAEQIKTHSFSREYIAIVYGNVRDDSGTINAPIGRHPKDRKKMTVVSDMKNGRNAVTHYQVIERFKGFTYMKFILETGRTHQIRVHSAYIGHPVAGDAVYGPNKVITELNGQCLHAQMIGFIHPTTKEYMEFTSELPEYFQSYLDKLKRISY